MTLTVELTAEQGAQSRLQAEYVHTLRTRKNTRSRNNHIHSSPKKILGGGVTGPNPRRL
jgi:hypothetical protein